MQVDVLYCGVKDSSGKLQEAVDRVVDRWTLLEKSSETGRKENCFF